VRLLGLLIDHISAAPTFQRMKKWLATESQSEFFAYGFGFHTKSLTHVARPDYLIEYTADVRDS